MALPPESPAMEDWFASLGDAAMETQRHLLKGHLEAVAAHAGTDAVLRRMAPSLADLLAPPQPLLQEMTADLQVDLSIDRSTGFELALQPLGSGYQRRFSTSSQSATRVAWTVRPGVAPDSLSSPDSE